MEMNNKEKDFITAHAFTIGNVQAIRKEPQVCGCCYCERIFDSSEINVEDEETVWCPYCNIDAVFGEK